jgi:hypothetical protein
LGEPGFSTEYWLIGVGIHAQQELKVCLIGEKTTEKDALEFMSALTDENTTEFAELFVQNTKLFSVMSVSAAYVSSARDRYHSTLATALTTDVSWRHSLTLITSISTNMSAKQQLTNHHLLHTLFPDYTDFSATNLSGNFYGKCLYWNQNGRGPVKV